MFHVYRVYCDCWKKTWGKFSREDLKVKLLSLRTTLKVFNEEMDWLVGWKKNLHFITLNMKCLSLALKYFSKFSKPLKYVIFDWNSFWMTNFKCQFQKCLHLKQNSSLVMVKFSAIRFCFFCHAKSPLVVHNFSISLYDTPSILSHELSSGKNDFAEVGIKNSLLVNKNPGDFSSFPDSSL